MVIRTPSC